MKTMKKISVVLMALIMTVALFAFTACDPADEKTTVDSVLTALQTQSYAAISTDMSGTFKQSGVEAGTVKSSAKLNLATGDADIVAESVGKGENAGVDNYSYIFMRDWNAYSYSAETKPAGLNSIEWSAEGNLNDMITEALQGEGIPVDFASIGGLASVCQMVLPMACHLELSFADAAGGITDDASAKTLTVDINKVLYNFVNDIKGVINGLTDSTTIGDLLNNETVKKYFSIITELVPVDTVKSFVAQTGLNVQPDDGSSTYDYIVKIISSEELKKLISEMAGMALPNTLDKFALSFFLNSTGVNIADIKTAFEQLTSGITPTQFSIAAEDAGVTLTNAKEVYAYDDNYAINSISSQLTIGMNVTGEGAYEISLSGTTNLLTSEVTLEEIDFSNVALPSDSTEFSGVYKFSSMRGSFGGLPITINVGDEGYTEDLCVMESYDDKTFTLTIEGGATIRGTWTQYGENIILNCDDREMIPAQISGNTFTFYLEESEVYFVLVKE